jgi:hypothetical protein
VDQNETDAHRFRDTAPHRRGVFFPTGYTVAVIDDAAEAHAGRRELIEAGIPGADVHLITGSEAIEIHQEERRQAGLIDKVIGACPPMSAASRRSTSCKPMKARTSWCSGLRTKVRRPERVRFSPATAPAMCAITAVGPRRLAPEPLPSRWLPGAWTPLCGCPPVAGDGGAVRFHAGVPASPGAGAHFHPSRAP